MGKLGITDAPGASCLAPVGRARAEAEAEGDRCS